MNDRTVTESETALDRLASFLKSRGESQTPAPLTPDASTREYFRISWEGRPAVACVYGQPFGRDLSYLDTTALFTEAGVAVAEVYETSPSEGIVIQEDLGDLLLSDILEKAGVEGQRAKLRDAISLIARIQAGTPIAFRRESIASKLRFDQEKLGWELDFFLKHHFESLRSRPLAKALEIAVKNEFSELVRELESFSTVLTHRDYHASNIMVTAEGELRLIDHQDARLGSKAYDLVSLLLDRVTAPPDEAWLEEARKLLSDERAAVGLDKLPAAEFRYEFDLVAVQRCLKAIGTFSNQAANFGKQHYLRFIEPMFGIVKNTCERLSRFPAVREMIITGAGNE